MLLNREGNMKNEWTEKDLRVAAQAVAKKAAADAKFRKLALRDPAAAIREVTGRSVPDGMKIDILESGKGGALQATVQFSSAPIPDAQLAGVTGGLMANVADEEQLAPLPPKCKCKARCDRFANVYGCK